MTTIHHDLAQRLATWSVTLPPDAVAAGSTWMAALAIKTANPTEELRESAMTGRLTVENVQEAIEQAAFAATANEKARDLIAALDFPLSTRFHQAIVAGADDIIEQLQPHFDKWAGLLATACKVIPADADAERVLSMGPDANHGWHQLIQSQGALDAIAEIRAMLCNNYSYDHDGAPVAGYLSVEQTISQRELDRAQRVFGGYDSGQKLDTVRGGNWRHLIDRGYTLRLNTRAEAGYVLGAARSVKPVMV